MLGKLRTAIQSRFGSKEDSLKFFRDTEEYRIVEKRNGLGQVAYCPQIRFKHTENWEGIFGISYDFAEAVKAVNARKEAIIRQREAEYKEEQERLKQIMHEVKVHRLP